MFGSSMREDYIKELRNNGDHETADRIEKEHIRESGETSGYLAGADDRKSLQEKYDKLKIEHEKLKEAAWDYVHSEGDSFDNRKIIEGIVKGISV